MPRSDLTWIHCLGRARAPLPSDLLVGHEGWGCSRPRQMWGWVRPGRGFQAKGTMLLQVLGTIESSQAEEWTVQVHISEGLPFSVGGELEGTVLQTHSGTMMASPLGRVWCWKRGRRVKGCYWIGPDDWLDMGSEEGKEVTPTMFLAWSLDQGIPSGDEHEGRKLWWGGEIRHWVLLVLHSLWVPLVGTLSDSRN